MSCQKIVLAADIGTSSLKAAFIDVADGAGSGAGRSRLLEFVREPYPAAISPAPVKGRHLKLPAFEWENAFSRALAALFHGLPDAKIEAVCISGNGPTMVPVQKKTHFPAFQAQNDAEALLPLYWFGKTEKIEGASSFFLPHIAWFMHKYPEKYENTATFYSCQEWLAMRLGAETVTVLPSPAYLPYYWDAAQCGLANINAGKLPPFVKLGEIIGRSSAEAEERFGLKKGIPIVAGGPDFIMALLGTATVEDGLVCDRAGSSEGINVTVSEAELEKKRAQWKNIPEEKRAAFQKFNVPDALRVLPHAIDGLWNVSVVLGESGSIFERWREENGYLDKNYDELLEMLIPDSHGEIHAVLLTIAEQVKNALAALEIAGFPVKEMRLSGGQARSARWNKLKAGVCGRALLVPEILDGELSGNAAAAMLALGEASTLAEACKSIVRIDYFSE
jgi:xylulokinase